MHEAKHYISSDAFEKLCHWANRLCGFYAGVAYLVGSSLSRPDFRDVDIVFVIEDEDFKIRFGDKYRLWAEQVNEPLTEVSWKYYKERIKRIRDGYYSTGLDLDIRIQCESEFLGHAREQKLKLDTSPFLPHLEEKIKQYAQS